MYMYTYTCFWWCIVTDYGYHIQYNYIVITIGMAMFHWWKPGTCLPGSKAILGSLPRGCLLSGGQRLRQGVIKHGWLENFPPCFLGVSHETPHFFGWFSCAMFIPGGYWIFIKAGSRTAVLIEQYWKGCRVHPGTRYIRVPVPVAIQSSKWAALPVFL